MPGSDIKEKQKSACSTKNLPVPEFISCKRCGDEIELWTDESETVCRNCGHRIFRKEALVH